MQIKIPLSDPPRSLLYTVLAKPGTKGPAADSQLTAENTSLRQIIKEREAEVANLKAALKSDGKKKEEAELSRREAAVKQAEKARKTEEKALQTLAQDLKEREDSLLVHMSDIASLQKRLESQRDEFSQLEAVIQQKQAGANERQRELGAAKMSLLNLAERCMKREHKRNNLSRGFGASINSEEELEKALEYVSCRMMDLQDIASQCQARSLVSDLQ